MTTLAVILFVNAAFNVLTWPNLYRRVVKDPRSRDDDGRVTKFFTVHLVLFIAAMAIAAVSFLAGVFALAGQFS